MYGEVAEWLKAHAWKACVPAMVPQVRILFSPPGENVSYPPKGGMRHFLFAEKAGFEPGSTVVTIY